MTLTEIGIKYNTDKATYHRYTDIYDRVLSHLREVNVKLLEIGVLYGSSIKMWEEYFKNGLIYGVDIYDKSQYNTSRITTLIANQEKEADLLSIPNNFDIIIDDGGHTMLQQQLTLKILLPKLKPGGIYILEDLHTSLPRFYNSYQSTPFNNTLKLLTDLAHKQLSPDAQYHITSGDFENLLSMIDIIEIHTNSDQSITSIIRKALN